MLKNSFRNFILLFLLLILFLLVSAISYVEAVSFDLQDTVFRLHVVANSNSAEDQNLKYIVRDGIIKYVSSLTNGVNEKSKVLSVVSENIEQINKLAQQIVLDNGYSYTVSVETGNFLFPTKTYGDIKFPSGYYDALKIKIGKAEGQNWWCVMFPPLCFIDVSSGIVPEESKTMLEDSLSEEEYALISSTNSSINVKFKIVEFFNNITAKIKS